MALGPLVAVPAAPLLLPAAAPSLPAGSRAAVAELRTDVTAALATLSGADVVVLLASGSEPLVYDARLATLASYGIADLQTALATDLELLASVSSRGQAPRVRSERLDGDLAVLAMLVAVAEPGVPVVPVGVPGLADAAALGGVAAGLGGAATAAGRRVALVAAADLAATLDTSSPGYLVDDAVAWDARARDAAGAGDPDAMGELGPRDAARVQARGWAPLTVLLTVAATAAQRVSKVAYHAPRGVGALVLTAGPD